MPGLLIARNNAQLFQQESAVEEQSVQRTRLESGLASHILNAWESNKRAKLDIEQKFLQNLRQRNGIYDSAKLALIKKTQGSEVFMKLTEVKCRAAESWLGDVYSPAYEKDGFTIKPTPEPEMPEYVLERIHSEVLNASYNMALQYIQEAGRQINRQEFNIVAQKHFEQLRDYESKMLYKAAEDAAQRMQRRIKDQLHDGGYLKAFEEVRRDIVTFGTGFLKGPVIRKRSVLKWKRTPVGYLPAMSQSLVYEYMRVSPFDIYPSPTAIEIGDGDLIERLRVRRADINALIGVRGYNETNLRRSLTEYSDGLNTSLPADQERFNAEGRGSASIMDSETIEMLSYWGNVQGWTLLEYGMTQDQIPDPDIDYPIHAQIIGNYVVKAVKNITGIIPYSKCVYTQIPGSFWGNGLPDELEDLQLIVNALARAIANNAAMASGPQVEVNIEKMRVGSDCNTLVPWKIWQTDNEGMQSNTPVVRFYQPKSIINELVAVYEKFSAEADVKTGIPSIAHGGMKMASGAGSTASGLSMYLEMAGKVIRELISRIDMNIVYPTITRSYYFNMMFDPDMSIKGDAKVLVRGVNAMSMQEQQALRKQEFLNTTNNPNDIQIMGLEGRRYILREAARILDMDVDKAVPLDRNLALLQEQLDKVVISPPEGNTESTDNTTTDVAGNPAGGTDVNMFNSVSQKGGQV